MNAAHVLSWSGFRNSFSVALLCDGVATDVNVNAEDTVISCDAL